MRSKRILTLLAIAALLAIVATACGSDKKSSTADNSGSSSSTAPPAKGAPITIGAIMSLAAATGPVDPNIQNALKAWEKHVNDGGGINGHPVKVIYKDDGGDPGKSTVAVKELVESNHVVALLANSGQTAAWKSYVEQQKIPVIGDLGSGQNFDFQTSPYFYPSSTTVLAILYGQIDAVAKAGKKSLAIAYCAEVSACAQAIPLVKGYGSKVGVDVVYAASASSTAPDYTANCVAAKKAGAEAFFVAGTFGSNVARDCKRQGYSPAWVQSQGTWSSALLKDPNQETAVGDVGMIPWFVSDASTKEMRAVIGQYLDKAQSPPLVEGIWGAGKLIEKAAAKVSDTPTSQDIIDGLAAADGDTLGGLVAPLHTKAGENHVNACYFLMEMKGGKFVSATGSKYSCAP